MTDADNVKGKWKQVKGREKQRWSNMIEREIDLSDREDERPGLLQERYGRSRDDAGADVGQLFNEL